MIVSLSWELVEIVLGVPAFEGYGLQPVHQVLPFQQRALAPEGIESQFELSQSLFQQVPRLLTCEHTEWK
jgi:hypothetical protein